MNIFNRKNLFVVLNKKLSNCFIAFRCKADNEGELIKITTTKPKTTSTKHIYVLFDYLHGDQETFGYVWIFAGKNKALEHLKWQNKQKNCAKLKLSKDVWYVNNADFYRKLNIERYVINLDES